MEVYEQFAVRESWILYPQNQNIEVYRMENHHHRLFPFAAEEGSIQCSVCPILNWT